MATSQSHGNRFEDYIKVSFFGSSNASRSPTSKFDIEARYDKNKSIPTSIKTTGSDTVGLADATRFFSIDEDYRLLILKYSQDDNIKKPEQLYEFIIDKESHKRICGDIPINLIQSIHSHLKSYEAGIDAANLARSWWKDKRIQIYAKFESSVSLNAKIDSINQRRLQASITLSRLRDIIPNHNVFYNSQNIGISYQNYLIPSIQSTSREFND